MSWFNDKFFAEASGGTDPQMAYTAGLVCDIGKLAIAYACAEYYPRISERTVRGTCTWAEAERAVLGYDRIQVGARLLRAWRFPEKFARAVELQAHPERAPAELAPLVAHLHAARYLAVSLGPGVTADGTALFATSSADGDCQNMPWIASTSRWFARSISW